MLEAFYSPSGAPQILTSAAFYLVWRLINVQLFICSSQEIESLLVNWSGPDLTGFGELVLEGSFKVHRVKKERAFFLFDKMLLIAKKRLEQFVYSTHIFVRASIFHDCLFSLMYYHPSCFTSKQPWSRNGIPASSPGFQLWVLSVFLCSLLLQCCNLLLVETLKDPLCFKVSDQTILKQQHTVQVSLAEAAFPSPLALHQS